MREPKALYNQRAPLIEDHPVAPKTMDILKTEIFAIRQNKWLDAEEKTAKLEKLKEQLAPRMPEHVYQKLIS